MYDFQDEFRRFAEERFASEMSIGQPGVPIQWDNVPFKQPSKGRWVSFCINSNAEKQITIGRKMIVRTTGFIQIDVLEREENGVAHAAKLANFAAEIFGYRKFKGETISVSFWEKHVHRPVDQKEFTRVSARIFFTYDGERIREGVQQIA